MSIPVMALVKSQFALPGELTASSKSTLLFKYQKVVKGVLTSSKRWSLYVGFISFSQMALVFWRIFAGSIWFQILYETSKYLSGHQRHLGEAN